MLSAVTKIKWTKNDHRRRENFDVMQIHTQLSIGFSEDLSLWLPVAVLAYEIWGGHDSSVGCWVRGPGDGVLPVVSRGKAPMENMGAKSPES